MIPKALQKSANVFDVLKKQDILVHHPFTSYSTVTDFIDEAAEDEKVLAIKICLYRAGKDSPIVKSLVKASRNGKQVAALVELKARFDEENNIEWARRLEAEGVHVIYGMRGLKTHSKVALVVREEGRRAAPLRSHCDRQLQPDDFAHLYRCRTFNQRRGNRRGRDRFV
jgi:polyphosphate kinase